MSLGDVILGPPCGRSICLSLSGFATRRLFSRRSGIRMTAWVWFTFFGYATLVDILAVILNREVDPPGFLVERARDDGQRAANSFALVAHAWILL